MHLPRKRPEQASFALISVLALVSLAALTATAFLAAARLEGQATRSIGDSLRLQLALTSGRECAMQILDSVAEPNVGWNFVTTYWRGTNATDLTNELGYLLVGNADSAAGNNLRWVYLCGFSPATWTNMDNTIVEPFVTISNNNCQGSFSNDVATFMRSAISSNWPANLSESATNRLGTVIQMLGNQTSPPVGWVYIRQDMRTNPSSTNTINVPVARFAFYIQDLGGLIDAERMGGSNARPSGTNPEEISLANLIVGDVSAPTRIAGPGSNNLASYTNKRPQYLTPGMMMSENGGILTNTNDLRYFASRIRQVTWSGSNWDRIPAVPLLTTKKAVYSSNAGWLKIVLNTNTNRAAIMTNIAQAILTNYPEYANRAGGMNGTNYAWALAANIVGYVSNSETAYRPPETYVVPNDPANTTVVGYRNYPLPTILFDRISAGGANISLNSYWQFWNCCNLTSPAVTYAFVYDFADTLNSPTARITPTPIISTVTIPVLPPGASYVVNAINQSFPIGGPAGSTVWIDGTAAGNITTNNRLTIYRTNKTSAADLVPSNVIFQMRTGFERKAKNIAGGTPSWSGGMPGLRYDNVAGTKTSFKVPPSGDPRMVNYFTNNSTTGYLSACDYNLNVEWQLGYAQTKNPDPWTYSGTPANSPDGPNTTNILATGKTFSDSTFPEVGTFSSSTPNVKSALPKLSTNSFFTNICELGNVFDPMQWVSTTINTPRGWVNCNITTNTTWSANSMYGGGQTLRIGRAEHQRFAFTNLGGDYSVPNMAMSAAGLLDLLTLTNTYDYSGKININTAPPPVLAALAGGVLLGKDANMKGIYANSTMVSEFTNGVMRFRSVYPFLTPSQLAFISANYGTKGWTNENVWPVNAVFSTNRFAKTDSNGQLSLNDEGVEEWFSKIYNLATVQSFNYRIYVVAQLLNTNGTPKGTVMRKYYQVYLCNNSPGAAQSGPRYPGDLLKPSVSRKVTYEAFY